MILMYALKTPLSAQCDGVLSTEHSVQSNPSVLSALSTEMHHQNKTLSTKCCHPHGHSVLSTSTVCAPVYFNMTLRGPRVTLFILTGSLLASKS